MDIIINDYCANKIQFGEKMRYNLIIPLLFILFSISGCVPIHDCGNDIQCFQNLVTDCNRATVTVSYDNTTIRLTSRGVQSGECDISLKIEKVSEKLSGKDPVTAKLAEGKTLNCAIPLKIFKENSSEYINNILSADGMFNQYCSGPIKDILKLELNKNPNVGL